MKECDTNETKEKDGKQTPTSSRKRRRKKKESAKPVKKTRRKNKKSKKPEGRITRSKTAAAERPDAKKLTCKSADDESSGGETLGEEDTEEEFDDDELSASDVDEYGNIVGLIDYEVPDEIQSVKKKKKKRHIFRKKSTNRRQRNNPNFINAEIIETHDKHGFAQINVGKSTDPGTWNFARDPGDGTASWKFLFQRGSRSAYHFVKKYDWVHAAGVAKILFFYDAFFWKR